MKGFPSVASRELTDWIVFYLSVTPGVFQLHMSGRIWGKLLFRYKLTQVFPVLLQSDQLSWHTVFPVSSSRCHLRVGERDLNHLSSFYISIYCRCSAVLHESRWLQLPSTCKVLCSPLSRKTIWNSLSTFVFTTSVSQMLSESSSFKLPSTCELLQVLPSVLPLTRCVRVSVVADFNYLVLTCVFLKVFPSALPVITSKYRCFPPPTQHSSQGAATREGTGEERKG